MKFVTHNDKEINSDGCSLVGKIDVDYETLVKLFGESLGGSADDKVLAEWGIEFEDGTVATIYNWKDGKNYDCENGKDVEDITNWHIGGKCDKAKDNVISMIENNY